MRIGIIGTGNMGTILTEALIEGNAIEEENIRITNRTLEKAFQLKNKYPQIHVETDANDLARNSEIIFICTKPAEIYPLLLKLKKDLTTEKCLISITSPISVQQLEAVVPAHAYGSFRHYESGTFGVFVTYGENCSDD